MWKSWLVTFSGSNVGVYCNPSEKLQVIEVVLGRKIQAQKELFAHMVNHLNMPLLSKDENEIEAYVQ